MTIRGRKPKPTALKIVGGTDRKRPTSREPIAEGDLRDPPSFLTEAQKLLWNEALDCAPKHLLKRVDSNIFVQWVVARDIHRRAAEELAKEGSLLSKTSAGSDTASPLVKIMNGQSQIIIRAAAEMGFTPASRSRVKLDTVPSDKPDPNEERYFK